MGFQSVITWTGLAGGAFNAVEAANITDGGTAGSGADAFRVAAYPVLRDLLNDASITNLDNSGLPFAPGDFSAAYQWTIEIAPGDFQGLEVSFSVNSSLRCLEAVVGVFCDRFESGDTSYWSAVAP